MPVWSGSMVGAETGEKGVGVRVHARADTEPRVGVCSHVCIRAGVHVCACG